MDKKKMMIDDLKNFNLIVAELKKLKEELNLYVEKEDQFKGEIEKIKHDINEHEIMIKKIKIVLQFLPIRDLEIITRYYFENDMIKNISYDIGLTPEMVSREKSRIVNKMARLMYDDDLMRFDYSPRVVPNKSKKVLKSIYQFDINGMFIKKWSSIKECIESCEEFTRDGIQCCCNGKYKTHRGYRWSYTPMI